MTIREAAKGEYSKYCRYYNIGFVNEEGADDQTQFENVRSLQELSNLFRDFCNENGFKANSVTYVERA